MPREKIDFLEEEQFILTGANLKTSIFEKIDDLKVQLNSFMEEVSGELDGNSPSDLAQLLLAVFSDKQLAPKALLIKEALNTSVKLFKEIEVLTVIYNNIDIEATYRLNLEQVHRYGVNTNKRK